MFSGFGRQQGKSEDHMCIAFRICCISTGMPASMCEYTQLSTFAEKVGSWYLLITLLRAAGTNCTFATQSSHYMKLPSMFQHLLTSEHASRKCCIVPMGWCSLSVGCCSVTQVLAFSSSPCLARLQLGGPVGGLQSLEGHCHVGSSAPS